MPLGELSRCPFYHPSIPQQARLSMESGRTVWAMEYVCTLSPSPPFTDGETETIQGKMNGQGRCGSGSLNQIGVSATPPPCGSCLRVQGGGDRAPGQGTSLSPQPTLLRGLRPPPSAPQAGARAIDLGKPCTHRNVRPWALSRGRGASPSRASLRPGPQGPPASRTTGLRGQESPSVHPSSSRLAHSLFPPLGSAGGDHLTLAAGSPAPAEISSVRDKLSHRKLPGGQSSWVRPANSLPWSIPVTGFSAALSAVKPRGPQKVPPAGRWPGQRPAT